MLLTRRRGSDRLSQEFNIFEHDANGVALLSAEGLRLADEHQCMHKNARDDRFTILAIPEMQVPLHPIALMDPP